MAFVRVTHNIGRSRLFHCCWTVLLKPRIARTLTSSLSSSELSLMDELSIDDMSSGVVELDDAEV
jgi:hypothetical protein